MKSTDNSDSNSSNKSNGKRQQSSLSLITTASDALTCRLASINKGYFSHLGSDPFSPVFYNSCRHITNKNQIGSRKPSDCVTSRPPVINRGSYARYRSIDIIIQHFLGHLVDRTTTGETLLNYMSCFHEMIKYICKYNS